MGLELDQSARLALVEVQRSLGRFHGIVRWIPVENLHLTLKFLGHVDDGRIPEICRAVERCAAGIASAGERTEPDPAGGRSIAAPFALAALGCFPPAGRARIVWAGVQPIGHGLLDCHKRLEGELSVLGFAPETRRFAPHLTLGRVRPEAETRALRTAVSGRQLDGPRQNPRDLVVFESTLTPTGARYTALARFGFGEHHQVA